MTAANASGEDIARTCAALRALSEFPPPIAAGLARDDPDVMRAAVQHLIDAGRLDGLRDLVERFRDRNDFGVWARVTSAQLYRATGEFAAALADIDDLMTRFPARAAAHWHIARARALEGLRRDEAAIAAAREAIARFPTAAPPRGYLANLLARLKRDAEALDVWREAHAQFPEPDFSWFVGLANALKALGRREEALTTLEDAGRRFPDDRRGAPLLAEAAERRGQWAEALRVWERLAGEPQAELGRARALFRLARIDEATACLDALVARAPDDTAALRERARIAAELGESEIARDLLLRLTQRFPQQARPETLAALARARAELGEDSGATLAELERRFPDSPLAARERLRQARVEDRGLEDLQALIAAARRRFPHDDDLAAQGVWIWLSLGRLDEAEREIVALEARGAPGYALAARLKLEADRGDANLRAFAESRAAGVAADAADAAAFGQAMLDARAPWAFALGLAAVEAAATRFPEALRLSLLGARLCIALGRDEAALARIDAIPARYRRRDHLELRAWAEARRGRLDDAKRLWAQAIAGNVYPALHGPLGALTRVSPDDRPPPEAGPAAYVVFRNEAAQIPGFLAHHRKLGLRRFVFFDHASTDDSRALALREPDTIVYDCPGSYQLTSSGRRWIDEVVAREGARGWGVQLDMDERLIYPGCESAPLDRFLAYLDARGFEAVRGFMLDLFAPGLDDPAEAHRWYDDDYYRWGLERAPYASVGGGVRARLFEAKEYLHKVPLWRLDAGRLVNSHETTPMRLADVSAALLHYKMLNFARRAQDAAPEQAGAAYLEADHDVDVIRRHSRYAARRARLRERDLREPGVSRELEDSLALAARGLMDLSAQWRALI